MICAKIVNSEATAKTKFNFSLIFSFFEIQILEILEITIIYDVKNK